MKLQLLPSLTSLPSIDLTSSILKNPVCTWESLCGVRDPNKITTICVHHDAIPKERYANDTDLEYASRIASGHIGITTDHKHGEPGNPYHVMIRNGQAYQINNLLAFTYGVSNHNSYIIHVCIAGEYSETDDITPEDYNMLNVVLVSLLGSSELPNLKVIKGHKEYAKTACPGIEMSHLRTDVYNIQKQLEYTNSRNNQNVIAYSIAESILFTYNTAKGLDQYGKPTVTEEGKEWARKRLLLLEPIMRDHEFLK